MQVLVWTGDGYNTKWVPYDTPFLCRMVAVTHPRYEYNNQPYCSVRWPGSLH